MKTPPRLQKLSRFARNALLWTVLAASPAWGQDVTKNTILQNKADQQDLRQHTALLAAQIQGLINELIENGISGDDLKTLTTTKALLNNLTAQEMQRVIASLQKAGDSAGTTNGERNLVDAYGGQKSIILEFRQILKDSEQRQAADELPAKFKELTDRQTQIMWTTAQDAAEIAGKGQQELNTMQQTTAQIVQADQNALSNDVAMAKQMLDKAAQDGSGDQGNAMQQAQKDITAGNLQASLDKANADLAAGHLFQATTEQKAARDALRQLTKDLNPPTTTVDALADFAATLQKIIDEQKDLLGQTNAAVGVKPRVIGLDAKQGILVDQTNSLQEDMQAMSSAAAGLVKDAITPMQIARADLGPRGGLFPKAADSEQDAISKLQQAAQQLTQQLADAQKAADEDAKDSTQKLQELQQQIQQAQQAQKQVSQNTAQAANDPNALNQAQQQQAQLQQATQQMQQAASPVSLPASQALANAQQAMQQAQQAMSNAAQAQQAQAQQAQQAQSQQAQQDQAQAQAQAQQAQQAQAQAQQAQQQAQQALQQANQAVQQAIAQDQQQTADPAQLAQAASQLQQAQSDVSNAQAAAQQQSSAQQASAQQASAQQASAQQASAQQASAQQASAQQAGAQQAGAQQAGAQQAGAQQAGAQQDASSMQQAAQALAQAAQATQAAAATPGLPSSAQAAIQNAQQDIAQGQQAAAQGNAPATANAAAAAQASLAQAQAAVAVAQAGMAPGSGPPPPGSGSGPPMPGTTPGMPGMPGTTPMPPGALALDGAQAIGAGQTDGGPLHGVSGKGKFITVMSRERTAISETQGEPRPQEYSPMIDQYLKNLSDQATSSSAQ